MSALTDDTLPVTPRAMRDEMIVFAAMAVLLGLVPLTGIYPFFVMQALCFALLAFILSGTLAGFAGSLKVFVAQNASLTDVHWSMSGEIVLMTLVGGLGTIFGPVVGAFVIIAMQQYLAGFGQWVTVIQGVIFVVCVLTFRRGVIGEIAHYFRRSL